VLVCWHLKVKFKKLDNNLFCIEKEFRVSTSRQGNDISGPYWMLLRINILSGNLKWISGDFFVTPQKKQFWLYVPPYSWSSEVYGHNTRILMKGLISESEPPQKAPKNPCLFYGSDVSFHNFKGAQSFFEEHSPAESVDLCPRPNGLSAKVKKLLDLEATRGISMDEISKRVKTSNAVISRYFKKDFKQSPSYYKRGLKVTIGTYSLLMQHSVTEAAYRAGYKDLSRFYKQFKEYMKDIPSSYQQKSK
jgi:AraC-like DNA-binding protein